MQVAHHLAAVTDTQRKTVAALEERGELVARTAIEQNGLGPPLTRAQHVAI